jgi:hypothetical protein
VKKLNEDKGFIAAVANNVDSVTGLLVKIAFIILSCLVIGSVMWIVVVEHNVAKREKKRIEQIVNPHPLR